MCLRDLDDVKKLFGSLSGTFIGVGMTAFSRITPAYFLAPYHIVSLKKTLDLPLLRAKADIFCLEEETGEPVRGKGLNSARLLDHSLTQQFLKKLPKPKHLLLYQNYPDLMELGKKEGWRLLANPADLRIEVGERTFFENMVVALGLPRVPGAIYPLEVIHTRGHEYWAEKLGPEFVAQLPDVGQGGGRGTFFIRSAQEYERLQVRLKEKSWRGVKLASVAIHRFVQGIPASVAVCLTRHGVLTSRLQRQLIDLPYCRHLPEDGIFCGHVWDETPWPSWAAEYARTQAASIGKYLWALGYKGILGIDFVIDEGKEQVYPLEINPRFTGAFPMLSLLYQKDGKIPLEVFHILEFLDVQYEVDVEALNEQYGKPIRGSHLLLFLPGGIEQPSTGRLRAGLYEHNQEGKRVSFVSRAIDYQDIKNDSQFIVIDGPLAFLGPARHHHGADEMGGYSQSAMGSPNPPYRLCRVLFSCPVVDNEGVLSPHALGVIEWIYGR